ncbi:MAG: LamG-like jellyroll fold domain-containing protein, partial [Planctomycetota bacterium]
MLAASLCLFISGCTSSSSGSGSAATTPAESAPPEVEARWTFDSISGGLILDSGSGGFHGEVIGGTIDADGRVDGALALAGSSRMVVDASALELGKWDAITIVGWIRTATTASSNRAVVAFGDLPQPSFALSHLGSSYQFEITGRGEVSGGTVVADRWTHVAASYGAGQLRLYLDGALIDSTTTPAGTLPPALSDLGIGAESDGDNGFVGAIDELSVYSRELSAAEILTIYTSTPPEPIEASDVDTITLRDVSVEIDLTIEGPDPDAIEVGFVDLPTDGTVEWLAAGPGAPWIARYTPAAGFVGTETFTYQAFVGTQLSNVATITVEVTPPPARGRVQIVDNNIVTDNGLPLRGDTITLADWNLGIYLDPHHWLEFRDDFHLNTIRLLVSRPPQYFSGGPGLDCFTPNYTCYDLDDLVDGERTALELIDAAVDLARRVGMYIVIDYHPVGGYDEADALAWWGEIAPRYANETHVLYELANEP